MAVRLAGTIWRIGEPWRDLLDEVLALNAVTVVTEHSIYHLNHKAGRLTRLPGPHAPITDVEILRVDSVDVATPCGLVLNLWNDRGIMSSRLALVVEGSVDIYESGHAKELFELVDSGTVAYDTRHRSPDCGALKCLGPPPV